MHHHTSHRLRTTAPFLDPLSQSFSTSNLSAKVAAFKYLHAKCPCPCSLQLKKRPRLRISVESIRPSASVPVATSPVSATDPSLSTPIAPGCCHNPILPVSGIQFDGPVIPTSVRHQHLKGEADTSVGETIEHPS